MSHLVIPVLVETKQIPTSIIIYFLSYLFSPSTGSVLLGDVVWYRKADRNPTKCIWVLWQDAGGGM